MAEVRRGKSLGNCCERSLLSNDLQRRMSWSLIGDGWRMHGAYMGRRLRCNYRKQTFWQRLDVLYFKRFFDRICNLPWPLRQARTTRDRYITGEKPWPSDENPHFLPFAIRR